MPVIKPSSELTYSEAIETEQIKRMVILVTHQRYSMQMCGLEVTGGEMQRISPEHRFYTNGERIEARVLQAGDLLQNKDGN